MRDERFGKVYTSVMIHPELSAPSKALYALLTTYANQERTCFPSVEKLADGLQMSIRQIQRLLKELEKEKVIVRYRKDSGSRRMETSLLEYTHTGCNRVAFALAELD